MRLGDLDLGYLGAYAVGLIVTGHLGDRCNLRKMLLIGRQIDFEIYDRYIAI